MTYLWAHLDQLQDFFDYYAISIVNHEHWLEVLDSPLPWDVPFGVLVDSYTPYSLDPVKHIKHSQHRWGLFHFDLDTLEFFDWLKTKKDFYRI